MGEGGCVGEVDFLVCEDVVEGWGLEGCGGGGGRGRGRGGGDGGCRGGGRGGEGGGQGGEEVGAGEADEEGGFWVGGKEEEVEELGGGEGGEC